MEIVKTTIQHSQKRGVKAVKQSELLARIPDRSGIHLVEEGILRGQLLAADLQTIHPKAQQSTWRIMLMSLGLAGDHSCPDPELKALLDLGSLPLTLNEKGRGTLEVNPNQLIKTRLDRWVRARRTMLVSDAYGTSDWLEHLETSYWPDYPELSVGRTPVNLSMIGTAKALPILEINPRGLPKGIYPYGW